MNFFDIQLFWFIMFIQILWYVFKRLIINGYKMGYADEAHLKHIKINQKMFTELKFGMTIALINLVELWRNGTGTTAHVANRRLPSFILLFLKITSLITLEHFHKCKSSFGRVPFCFKCLIHLHITILLQ